MDPKLVFQTLYRPVLLATNPFSLNILINMIESEMLLSFLILLLILHLTNGND